MAISDLRKTKKRKVDKSSDSAEAAIDSSLVKKSKGKRKAEERSSDVTTSKPKKKSIKNDDTEPLVDAPVISERQKEKTKKKKKANESAKKAKKPKGSSSMYFKDLWKQFLEESLTLPMSLEIPDENICTRVPSLKIEENDYLTSICPDWSGWISDHSSDHGAPLVLLVSAAAVRSIALNRSLLPFKSESCKSAKLFSKHMKKDVQAAYLKSRIVHWGFGTPKRIEMLIDDGSLSLKNLRLLILDFNHRDGKDRRICDMKETRSDTFELIGKYMIPLLNREKEPVKLVLL